MYCVMETKVWYDLDSFLSKKSALAIRGVTTWVPAVSFSKVLTSIWSIILEFCDITVRIYVD